MNRARPPARSTSGPDGATLHPASNGVTVSTATRSQSPDPVSDGPVRTCIGCRRTAQRSVLLRVVGSEVEGRLLAVPDPGAVRPGRGAWLHRDRECVELAERRRAFARSLRLAGPVDPTAVRDHLQQDDTTARHHGTTHQPEAGRRGMSTP